MRERLVLLRLRMVGEVGLGVWTTLLERGDDRLPVWDCTSLGGVSEVLNLNLNVDFLGLAPAGTEGKRKTGENGEECGVCWDITDSFVEN